VSAQDEQAKGTITYLSGSNQLGSLYSLDVATGEVIRITQGIIRTYDWSPDGKRLALGDGSSIFVTDADGSNLQVIAAGSHSINQQHYSSPVWSPDGTRLAFAEYDNFGYVKIVDSSDRDESHVVTIKATLINPPLYWSPDGNSMAYYESGAPDASFTLVTGLNDCRPPKRDCHYPQFTISGFISGWSPDGTRLAISGAPPCCWLSIHSIDLTVPDCADTSTRNCALTGDSVQPVYDTPFQGEVISETMQEWSPDGKSILLLSNRGGGHLYRMDAVTGAARQVPDTQGFYVGSYWSPDGNHIAYLEVDTDHPMENYYRSWLMLMNTDSSQTQVLATYDAPVWNLQWRPA
jgi:Tol biopolymer transport system component